MKKLKMIVLASALLLTGCSKSEDKIKEVKKEIMVDAIETSKDLIDQKMYEQAKGVLEFVDKKGYSNIEGYGKLAGQIDRILLANEYYEKGKYQ